MNENRNETEQTGPSREEVILWAEAAKMVLPDGSPDGLMMLEEGARIGRHQDQPHD